MIYLFQILLAGINVAMAWYHSRLIKAGKKINHGLWGGAYLMAATLLSWSIHDWWLVVLSLFIRKVVFDLSLNYFRFGWKDLFYVTLEVKNVRGLWDAIRKGKTIDWLHYKVFGFRSEIYMGIYMLVIIVLNVLLFNKII